MLDYKPFFQALSVTRLSDWQVSLKPLLENAFDRRFHGKMDVWLSWLGQLPVLVPSRIDLNSPTIVIGDQQDILPQQYAELEQVLHHFHPWRKGPFSVFGIDIDTEWRSDWKWDRLKDVIQPLSGRLVLDVGCGSGYHA
jgi:tRNA (mo5U34)-methyltransferase